MCKSANILIATLALAASGASAAETTPAITPAKPATTESPKTPMPTNTTPAQFESMEVDGQKYLLVSSIKAVEANKQFQHNVQLLQNQLAALKELQKREQEALTIVEKEALKGKIIELNKSFEQNNMIMAKTYGFSITRNYLTQIIKTNLLTPVTDKEYEEQKKDAKFNAENYTVNDKERLLRVAVIKGVAENDLFRQNVQVMNAQRNRLVQIRQAADRVTDEKEKAKFEEEFKKSESSFLENNEKMFKSYGFSLARNYVLEIEESKLFLAVSKEEFDKQKAEADAKSGPAAPAKPAETPAK